MSSGQDLGKCLLLVCTVDTHAVWLKFNHLSSMFVTPQTYFPSDILMPHDIKPTLCAQIAEYFSWKECTVRCADFHCAPCMLWQNYITTQACKLRYTRLRDCYDSNFYNYKCYFILGKAWWTFIFVILLLFLFYLHQQNINSPCCDKAGVKATK